MGCTYCTRAAIPYQSFNSMRSKKIMESSEDVFNSIDCFYGTTQCFEVATKFRSVILVEQFGSL